MTQTTSRRAWLGGLLGLNKAEEVVADTLHAAAQLDKAGVERKAMKPGDPKEDMPPEDGKPMMEDPASEETTEPPTEAAAEPEQEAKQGEGDMVTEVGAKLAQQILDASGGNLASLTQEQLAVVIADALRPAVEEETTPAPTPEAAAAPSEEQQLEDSNKAASVPVQEETSKAFGDLLGQILADQSTISKAYIAQTARLETVEQELTATKALTPVVEELVKQINALQARLGDRPRQASAAEETTLDPQADAAKAIESAIKKSAIGKTSVLGIPVRE